jgi:GNAT superfamily N-acetyltransferase
MKVRRLDVDDSAALVPLLEQLGYSSTERSIRGRVACLLSDSRVGCWVADDNAQITGLITGHLSWHIEFDGPVARLTALVVEESTRGQGIARQLTAAFEDWARLHNSSKASLNSNMSREDAHAVYAKLGWVITGVRFAKDLS